MRRYQDSYLSYVFHPRKDRDLPECVVCGIGSETENLSTRQGYSFSRLKDKSYFNYLVVKKVTSVEKARVVRNCKLAEIVARKCRVAELRFYCL